VLLSGWLPVVRQQHPRQQWLAASLCTPVAGASRTAAAEQWLGCSTEPQFVELQLQLLLLLLLPPGQLLEPGLL
jgi:hypothetical protein